MSDEQRKIQVGDYIIIQRQKYTKLHKYNSEDSNVMLGKEQLQLKNINGHNYFSTFKMIPKEGRAKRNHFLEICTEKDMRSLREILGIQESGTDNRNITDNGESQSLKTEDIEKLREECTTSSQIVEKIVENSKTFSEKTEYAQEKYLKKKEKKYFEYVQIKEPTIRLISEIYYRQDPDKVLGIRMDSLSQIISYSGVSCFGNYLLYESGTGGLLPAAFINSIGANTEGKLIHMHPGNFPQKQALMALNLPKEQEDRCISVNVYSVLREFYQNNSSEGKKENEVPTEIEGQNEGQKRKLDPSEVDETPIKKLKTENEITEQENVQVDAPPKESNEKRKWEIDNGMACEVLREKVDSLVIASREHPLPIVKALLPFLKPSRPIVIFNLSKEILMELYVELKSTTEITGIHLVSNWLRMYQILPNRTHPEVNMGGNSGYILHGHSIR